MKKLWMSVLLGLGIFCGNVFAQTDGPDSFKIEVRPTILQQNAPSDITITAMKNGSPYLYYTGDVFITIDGLSLREFTLPSQGRSNFVPQDRGKITFNKGLEIKKEGEFTIRATNYDDSIVGSLKVQVVNSLQSPGTKTITIVNPQAGSTTRQETLMMSARSLELPNSPAQIYLNDVKVGDSTSDAEGNITTSLIGLKEGNNTLKVEILSSAGEVVGTSEKITFAYSPIGNNLFKKITATPSTGIVFSKGVTFEIETDPVVSSAQIIFDNGERVPTNKISDGKFSRDAVMITTGQRIISLELSALGEISTYSGVMTFFVDQDTIVTNVKFQQEGKDMRMSWEVVGKAAQSFEVKYGTEKEQLDKMAETTIREVIFTNIDMSRRQYFQITPLFGTEKTHGAASDIYDWLGSMVSESNNDVLVGGGEDVSGTPVVIDAGGPVGPLCVVKGIKVTTQKVGGKYYLVWNSVPNVTSYIVYSADTLDSSKKMKLLETTDTRYEYPFDLSSEEDIFAYFWVEGICDDGQVLQIANAKKVQVGPAEDILMLVCLSLLIYAGIRLYRYAE